MSIVYTQKHTQNVYRLGSYREFPVRGLILGKAEVCSHSLCHRDASKDHSQYWSVFGAGESGASLIPVFPVLTPVIYTQVKVAQRGEGCLAFAQGHVFNCSFLHSFLMGLQQCQVRGKHRE